MELSKEPIETPCAILPNKSTNFRNLIFEFNNIKYEIGVSLYSNAILIIITTNGKIGNLYSLDLSSEHMLDSYTKSQEDKELETAECLLGNRRDERSHFISNVLLSLLSNKISLKSSKIQKLVLSIALPPLDNDKEFELGDKYKQMIDVLKEKLLLILDI